VDKVLAALLEIDGVETTIPNLVELRKMAKAEKKFEKADHIRDFLRAQGVQLLDRADGTTDWERV
jgi:cysteinyl-tRNA synthetase